MAASTRVDLEAHLAEVRTALVAIPADAHIRATLPANAAYPQSASHIIIDLIPSTPTTALDGSIYEDLVLQLGAWSLESLVSALALAEAARAKMAALGYARTGGTQLLAEDAYHGVVATYTLVGAFDSLT